LKKNSSVQSYRKSFHGFYFTLSKIKKGFPIASVFNFSHAINLKNSVNFAAKNNVMQLILATNNPNKVLEINEILRGSELGNIEVSTMKNAIGHTTDLPETHETIVENAIEKAEFLYKTYGKSCFSEDSGLEIDALGGLPGVHTAHYSGSREPKENIALVLKNMGNTDVRTARFRTVICLILDGEKHLFEGVCEGKIRKKPMGTEGFGYDPIFEPKGFKKTFAQMDNTLKGRISHRGKATVKLLDFLLNLQKNKK
jgi:XTP/dITP diphosphohydrolase